MGFGGEARRSYENGFRNDMEMKIMIFPVNIDKFTGFFNKFLKIFSLVIICKIKSYHVNLSVPH